MKKSTIAIITLLGIYLAGALICDVVLAARYRSTDLNDPLKNFHDVRVKAFKVLDIRGGNAYAIKILQGNQFDIKLMNSRTSFFHMAMTGDTLKIRFDVANQDYQDANDCLVGLIITAPELLYLSLSGTNNIITGFQQRSFAAEQDGRTFTAFTANKFDTLLLNGSQESIFDLQKKNETAVLNFCLKNKSTAMLNGILFQEIKPGISDSAHLVFYPFALKQLKTAK